MPTVQNTIEYLWVYNCKTQSCGQPVDFVPVTVLPEGQQLGSAYLEVVPLVYQYRRCS